jgi:hypothetical protein
LKRVLICCLALFAGCATTASYQKTLQSWVGSSVDSLVKAWGPPQSSYELSDGGQILEYIDHGKMHAGGYTFIQPQNSYTPVYNMQLVCLTRFTVSPKGIITNSASQGNNCKARTKG